jgi:hypothetical protein
LTHLDLNICIVDCGIGISGNAAGRVRGQRWYADLCAVKTNGKSGHVAGECSGNRVLSGRLIPKIVTAAARPSYPRPD